MSVAPTKKPIKPATIGEILQPFKNLFSPKAPTTPAVNMSVAPKPLGPVKPLNMSVAPTAPAKNPNANISYGPGGPALIPQVNASTFKPQPTPQIKSTPTAPKVTPTAPVTPPAPTQPLKPADDPSNKYNTTTGELNSNYTGYEAPKTGSSGSTPTSPKKPAVPVVSDTQKAIKTAEDLYSKSLKLSPDELSTQGDLDRLSEATRKAYTGIKDKAIPLEFITGQLASVEERALNLAQPLEQRLARLQAARTSALTASKFALERADNQLKLETEKNKPLEVGGSLIKLNPETGQYETIYKGSTSQPASVQEYEYAKANGFTGTFEEYQDADANRKRIAMGAGGLTTSQQNAAFKLSDDYRAESKDFFTQKAAYNRILSSASDPSAAGDLALIFNYMKVLDPGSTVREGEFATAQNSGSIPEIIYAKYNKIQSGERLAPEQRKDFVDRATKLFTGAQQAQKQIDDTYTERANRYGVPLDLILSNTSANNQPAVTLESYYRDNPDKQGKIDQIIQENPTLSDDDVLQIVGFNSAGNASGSNRPQKNNNPLNIKASQFTQSFPGVVGTDPKPATDGGKFLVFDSPGAGFQAAAKLIQSDGYKNLTVDSAMRRWSGGGYGGEVAPAIKSKTIASLTQAELNNLIDAMAKREGYYA